MLLINWINEAWTQEAKYHFKGYQNVIGRRGDLTLILAPRPGKFKEYETKQAVREGLWVTLGIKI